MLEIGQRYLYTIEDGMPPVTVTVWGLDVIDYDTGEPCVDSEQDAGETGQEGITFAVTQARFLSRAELIAALDNEAGRDPNGSERP